MPDKNIPQTLKEANELILATLGEITEPMICGFLPLSQQQEDAVIDRVRNHLKLEAASVESLMRTAPAAGAYALATAPSRKLTDGGHFWDSLKNDLGLVVSNPARTELAERYVARCKKLGFLSGTIPECGWTLAAPFIFQAGILHHWTDDLANGIRAALKTTPAPDITDDAALRVFANTLARFIPGQPTLKKILGTEVGALIVRRLLRCYVRQEWGILPPHLQEPIKTAFAEVGTDLSLRSPYVAYDEALGSIELVLPTQNSRLTTIETAWQIGGVRFSARTERRIPLSECPQIDPLALSITRLGQNFANQSFVLNALWGHRPFRVFRHETQRERPIDVDDHTISLSPGNYIVLLSESATCSQPERTIPRAGFAELPLTVRPGEPPLVISAGKSRWTIQAELRPGVYLDRSVAKSFTLESAIELHYGERLGLVAYVPVTTDAEPELNATIRCATPNVTDVSGPIYGQRTNTIHVFTDGLDALFEAVRSSLRPGFHQIQIDFAFEGGAFTRRLWYWKGLVDESSILGFRCEAWPENIDLNRCRGFQRSGLTLRPAIGYHTPTCVIALTGGQPALVLPRLGIQVLLRESDSGIEDEPNPDIPLVVGDSEKRTLVFTIGGGKSWTIKAGDRVISELTPQRPRFAISLSGLAQEMGGSGKVHGSTGDEKPIHLLTFLRPLAASSPIQGFDHANNLERWTFTLPQEKIHALAYRVTDLTERPNAVAAEPVLLAAREPTGVIKVCDANTPGMPLHFAVTQLPDGRLKVVLEFHLKDVGDQLLIIDVLRQEQGDRDWITLDTIERTGYAKLRLLLRGSAPASVSSSWWRQLRRLERTPGNAPNLPTFTRNSIEMSADDLKHALERSCELLSFKYPGNVWKAAAYQFQVIPEYLAAFHFTPANGSSLVWWKHACQELAVHSEERSAPVVRRFLASTQPDLLAQAGNRLGLFESPGRIIDRSLSVPALIHQYGGLKSFVVPAMEKGILNQELIFCYGNFQAVSRGVEKELGRFSVQRFLLGDGAAIAGLSAGVGALKDQRVSRQVTSLLSAEHLYNAVRALNQRARPLESAANSDEAHVLNETTGALTRIDGRFHQHAPALANLPYGIVLGEGLWTPPLLENRWGEIIARALMLVTGYARAAAGGAITLPEYRKQLSSLLVGPVQDPVEVSKQLSRLLSMAPELFAFYFALFSFAHPPSRVN